MGIFSSAIFFK